MKKKSIPIFSPAATRLGIRSSLINPKAAPAMMDRCRPDTAVRWDKPAPAKLSSASKDSREVSPKQMPAASPAASPSSAVYSRSTTILCTCEKKEGSPLTTVAAS